jgi:RNA polymerase sigma factor (sigma-70 family)
MSTTSRRLPPQLLDSLHGLTVSDGELLRRYAEGRDEGAFAELVRRNGPLVLRTCRHVVGETAAAEDAFQATFLLLACKAARLPRTGTLAGWLHTVAVRTARSARRAESRRRAREQARQPPPSPPTPADELTWREVRERLDAELAALPEKYRAPLALCYFQELTYEDAAGRAGISVGALRGRLERGKALLRKRLARYGLPLVAPVLALGRPPSVHAALTVATLRTARAGLTGTPVAPAVATLVGSSPRWKAALLALAGAAAVAVGLTLAAPGAPRAAAPPGGAAAPEATLPVAAAAPAPRPEVPDDPLPPGAVLRLGTRRYQVSTFPIRPVALPGGKAYLVYSPLSRENQTPEFRWMDAATGKVTDTWPITNSNQPIGVSPDGRRALFTGWKGIVFLTGVENKPDRSLVLRLYDLTSRREVKEFRGEFDKSEGDWPNSHGAHYSADGKWIATLSGGFMGVGRVRLWNVERGQQVWASEWEGVEKGPSFAVLGFTPDGAELVLLATKDNRVIVVDTARGRQVREFPTAGRDAFYNSDLSPDGSAVVAGGYAPDVRRWDVKTGKELPALTGHKKWARMIAFSADGKTLVTGGSDDFVLVRDWPSGKVRKRIDLGRGGVGDLLVSDDGRTLTVLFWWEKALHRYDLETGRALPFPADSHMAEVYGVETLPDGSVLSLGGDTALRTWSAETGRLTATRHLDPTPAWAPLALSPDGKVVAVGDYDRTALVLYDRETGTAVRKIATKGKDIDRGVFSADGRWVAGTGQGARSVLVWDAATGEKVFEAPAKAWAWGVDVPACAFSPDGRWFVTADGDAVRVWEAGTWRAGGKLPVSPGTLTFSPDGRTLACVAPNQVTLWEMSTRARRFEHKPPEELSCATPRFSPDGRFLAWATSTRTVQVWDLLRGTLLPKFQGHDSAVTALTFAADGRRLVSASSDCTLLVWDVAGSASRLKVARQGEKEVRAAWDDLGSRDGEKAFAAVRTMVAAPEASVALLRDRLRPAAPAEAAKVRRLLADLDSDEFEARERALDELKEMGAGAEGHLRKFLAGKPSPEARRRAENVLAALPEAGPRAERAVEVLERSGTAAARELLRRLASGDADATLTRDARAALRRLERGR